MKRLIFILPYALLLGMMTLLNCNDDEPEVKPQISFLTTASSASEGETIVVPFNIVLPTGATPVYSLDGTAVAGIDYTHSVTPTGIAFVLSADDVQDPDEPIVVTLISISGDAELGPTRTHTLTVVEPPAVVEFQSAASTGAEGQTIMVPFSSSLPQGITPTVTIEGSAIDGEDYTYTMGQIGIDFTLIDDGVYDPDKTVIITLTEVSGNAQLGSELVHTLTISEAPFVLEFSDGLSTVSEGQEIKLFFEKEIPEGIAPIFVFGGTASQGTDFTYALAQDGIVLTTIDDGLYDPDETIMVTLTGASGNATLGDATTHIVNVEEAALIVEFASSSSIVQEGDQIMVAFALELPEGVLPTYTLNGTAIQGTDYTSTLAPNGITFMVRDDGQFESEETLLITLTGVTGNAILGDQKDHVITIRNKPLVVEFASPSSSVAEGQSITVLFNVPLPAGIVPEVSFGGTAEPGTDFTYTIDASGVVISAASDGLYDPSETIEVTLTGITGNAALGTQSTHAVTVTEPPLVLEFASANSTVAEGAGTIIPFNITLPTGVVPVVSIAGTATTEVDFAYSITTSGIIVNSANDDLYDPNETIIITLTGISGNAVLGTQTTHTITATETPLEVEFSTASSAIKEEEQGTALFTFSLPQEVIPTFTLSGTAVTGTDYTYSLTSSGIEITVLNDGTYDPGETLIITLTGVSGNAILGSQVTHTVTIEDLPLVVEFAFPSSSVAEGEASVIAFNLVLPGGVVPVIALSGTATSGVDYSYSITESGIAFSALEDDTYDPGETVVITLEEISGNAQLGAQITHTITMDEAPLVIEFAAASSDVQEGSVLAVLFEEPLPEEVVPVISLDGTATQGSDYSYSVNSAGVVVTTTNDGSYDPNETIVLTITGISGNAVLGTRTVHTVTITEPPIVVQFATPTSSVAEGSVITVPFNLTLPAGVVPTISLGGNASQPNDYSYNITPSGVVITASGDGLYDPNETIVLTLTGISGNAVLGAQVEHTIAITETPIVVEFVGAGSTAKEGEEPTVAFSVVLPAEVVPTASFSGSATSGVDYVSTINPNGILLNLAYDETYDPDETIIITLTSVTGNAVLGTSVTHTLTVSELPLTVEFQSASSSAEEGKGHIVSFNLTLPAGVVPSVSVSGTATLESDFTYSVTPGGVGFNLASDGVYDPDETLIITITGVSGNAELGTLLAHTVTITEPPLVVEFGSVASSIGEGSSLTVPFTFVLPDGVSPIVSTSGTASSGVDYTFSVTAAGIEIETNGDSFYDPNETIILTLTGVTGNAELGTQIVHTVTVTEPPIVVEFAAPSSTVDEGSATTVAFNITLPAGVMPTYTLGGSAAQGEDYSVTLIATGLQITTTADGVYDPNETITITLTGVSGNALLGTLITHTLTITEPPLIVEFAAASSTLAEGAEITVPYNMVLPAGVIPSVTVGGTATPSTDFSYTVTQNGIVVGAITDGLYDPGETIVITLTGVSGNAQLGTLVAHTITITEAPLVVEFAVPSSSIQEGSGLTVSFNAVLPSEVIPVVSVGGTAALGSDFNYTVTTTGIQITTTADGVYDPNETIIITLTAVSGNAVLGTRITHTVTVTEPPIVVEFALIASSVTEDAGTAVAFNMSLPPEVVPTVSLGGTATPGTDFTYSVTSTGIQITTVADGLYDPNETINISLTSISGNAVLGSQIIHTVTITESPLVVEFSAPSSSVSEGQGTAATFTIALPPEVIPAISIGGTATQGSDYTYVITNTGITITTVADALYESNETIVLTLTGVSGNAVLGSTTVHTITINEPALVVGFATASSTGLEGTTHTVPFNVTLPPEVVPTIGLGGTATLGVDYTYSIASDGIVFTLADDGLLEPDETVILTITSLTGNAELGGNTSHTLTITETPPTVEFESESSVVLEGENIQILYNMVLPGGVLPTILISGSASNPADFTYSVTQSGIAIQTVEDWIADQDETIVVTMTGVSGGAALGSVLTHTVTITDPLAPVIEFVSASSSVTEGGNVALTFTAPLPQGVFPVVTLEGTATEELDYVYSFTTNAIVFYALGDGVLDNDETVVITLMGFTGTGSAELGTSLEHTITITDAPIVIGFLASSVRRIEGTGAIAAFSQPLPSGVTPIFNVTGSASSGIDYTISQGPSGFIINTLVDQAYDPEETVTIELTGFTGNVVLGPITTYTLTIQDEDEAEVPRMEISLSWDAGDGTPGDVDMDLILWYETSPGNFTLRYLADNVGTNFEDLSVLSNVENGRWGLSYVYYSGTSDNVNFTVNFRVFKGNIGGTSNRATYSATYSLANINPWAETQVFYIEQYYQKSGTDYDNFTGIQVPVSGSRIRSFEYHVDPQRVNSKKLLLQPRQNPEGSNR